MKNRNEGCAHEWSEGICVNCGTEFHETKREPEKSGFLLAFLHRFWFALRTGINPAWVEHLSKSEQKMEIRRLKYNAAKFESADRKAQIRRAQFSQAPIIGILIIGAGVFLLMVSMVVLVAIQPSTPATLNLAATHQSVDKKWPGKCNPTVPGVVCTARNKKTKKPEIIIILPQRICDQDEKQDTPCYLPPPDPEAPDKGAFFAPHPAHRFFFFCPLRRKERGSATLAKVAR